MIDQTNYAIGKTVASFLSEDIQPSFKTQTKDGLVDLLFNDYSYYMEVIVSPANYVELKDGTLISLHEFWKLLQSFGCSCSLLRVGVDKPCQFKMYSLTETKVH